MDSGVKRRNRRIRERKGKLIKGAAAMATHDSCFCPSVESRQIIFVTPPDVGWWRSKFPAMCRYDGDAERFLRSALRRNGAAEAQSRGSALGSRLPGGDATANHQLADN